MSSERTAGLKGQRWAFKQHAHNVETGVTWVDIYDKNDQVRSFREDEISLPKVKRKYTRRK